MSKLTKIKKMLGRRQYDPFNVFIDGIQHEDTIRLNIFLTTINYHVGELQYIKGEVTIIEDTFVCEFSSNVYKDPLVRMKISGFDEPKMIVDFVDRALKKCVNELTK